jgi:hypothetical protein
MLRRREKNYQRGVLGNITFGFASLPYVQAIVLSKIICANQNLRLTISHFFSPVYVGGDARRNQPQFFNERENNCGNQTEIFDRNATLFNYAIDIIHRSIGYRSDVDRSHTATRAHRYSSAGWERGFLRGSRRRHTELHLPALRFKHARLRFWRRLFIVYAAGHVVQRPRRASYHPLLQPQPFRGRRHTRHMAALSGHKHRLGQSDRILLGPNIRHAGGDSLAPCTSGWGASRTNGGRQADKDHLYSAIEYRRGRGALEGL